MKLKRAEIIVLAVTIVFVVIFAVSQLGQTSSADSFTVVTKKTPDAELVFVGGDADRGTPSADPSGDILAAGEKINLNSASLEELMLLPGVGEVIAARIIEYREEHGEFKSADEVINVKGIGDKTYEAISGFIMV